MKLFSQTGQRNVQTGQATTKDPNTLRANWKCIIACAIVSTCPFQYGIDFGMISGFQAMPGFLEIYGYRDKHAPSGFNISTQRQQLISSFMVLGAMIASGLSGPLAWKLGRKPCLWLASLLCCVANIIMMVDTSITGLYAGRWIIGLANGLFMTFSQLYLQEVAPTNYRGVALAAFNVWTSIGQLVGTVVDNYTTKIPSRKAYLIPLGLIYIVPVILSIGLLFIPESPRWLMENDKEKNARGAMKWLRPDSETAEIELHSIEAAIDEERQHQGKALWLEMWTNPIDRRRSILSIAAVNTQAASGAMYMFAFGTYFFEMAKVGDPFRDNVLLAAIGVLAMLITAFIIKRWGRRRVFLTNGLILCGSLQLTMAAVFTANPRNASVLKAVVALSLIYIFCFNGMISSYAWLAGGEIPSQRLRSYTFGWSVGISFLLAWLINFTAPYFINPSSLNWGPRYGYIWAPSCFIAAAFIFFFLPECKGRSRRFKSEDSPFANHADRRTVEEIDEMFAAQLPARKFRTYECRGPGATSVLSRADNESGDGDDTAVYRVSLGLKSGPNLSEAVERAPSSRKPSKASLRTRK